jgi:hypothetical protein
METQYLLDLHHKLESLDRLFNSVTKDIEMISRHDVVVDNNLEHIEKWLGRYKYDAEDALFDMKSAIRQELRGRVVKLPVESHVKGAEVYQLWGWRRVDGNQDDADTEPELIEEFTTLGYDSAMQRATDELVEGKCSRLFIKYVSTYTDDLLDMTIK